MTESSCQGYDPNDENGCSCGYIHFNGVQIPEGLPYPLGNDHDQKGREDISDLCQFVSNIDGVEWEELLIKPFGVSIHLRWEFGLLESVKTTIINYLD